MSQAQAVANAANSRLSTGPKSEEGKRISSANATRHGLTAKQVVLPGEDAAAYEDFRTSLLADWNPANTQEALPVRICRACAAHLSALATFSDRGGLLRAQLPDSSRHEICAEPQASHWSPPELRLLRGVADPTRLR